MYTHAHTCTHMTTIYVWAHICTHLCMHTHMYTHAHTCMDTHAHTQALYTHACAHKYAHAQAHMCTCICMHIGTHIFAPHMHELAASHVLPHDNRASPGPPTCGWWFPLLQASNSLPSALLDNQAGSPILVISAHFSHSPCQRVTT